MHTCMIDSESSFAGDQSVSQVGDGTELNRAVPVQIGNNDGWSMVSGGYYSTCGIESGKLYCWGETLGSYVNKEILFNKSPEQIEN